MVHVINTGVNDLEQIFELFEHSINYQEKKGYPVWRNYDKDTIIKDVADKNHYKVLVDSKAAIVFSVRYTDKIIWRDLDEGNSIYLNRIVVNPEFKGQQFIRHNIGLGNRSLPTKRAHQYSNGHMGRKSDYCQLL